jgi:hypothetical protein
LDLYDGFRQAAVITHSGTRVHEVLANEVNQVIGISAFWKYDQSKIRVKTLVILSLKHYCTQTQRQILFHAFHESDTIAEPRVRDNPMKSPITLRECILLKHNMDK